MQKGKLPPGLKELMRGIVGSVRYGYQADAKDTDFFVLTSDTDFLINDFDNHADYFVHSVQRIKEIWGHPLLLGNLTSNCTGDWRLVTFLENHRHAITYAAPGKTVDFGLDYISVGERYKFDSPIKAGLRTAYILSHMAEEREDPFLLSDEEKVILIRARTGDVPPEERAEIYRRTICPANLDKLRRMPENTRVRDELFTLLDEICKEGTP